MSQINSGLTRYGINWSSPWRIVILSLCVCSAHGQSATSPSVNTGTVQSSQFAPTPHSPNLADTPTFLPPDSASDAAAVQAFQKLIDASGGNSSWNSVRSAKSRFRSPDLKNGHHDSLLLDDWSSQSPKYRRGVIGSGKPPRDHSDQKTISVSDGHSTRTIPEFDQGRILADHLPTAAIQSMLGNPVYVVKAIPAAECDSGYTCVNVYRLLSKKGPLVKEQEWKLNDSTALATQVQLQLPDVQHGSNSLWETIKFNSYEQEGGLQVPSSISAVLPGGFREDRTLLQITFGAAFDETAFDKEVAQ